jgi:hypothetical protein
MPASRWTTAILNDESLLKKLLLALLLLNMGDMISTIWGLESGIFIEANPLLRWCINKGMMFFILVKTALCVQFVLTALLLAKKIKQFANQFTLLTFLVILVYSAVVIRTIGLLI